MVIKPKQPTKQIVINSSNRTYILNENDVLKGLSSNEVSKEIFRLNNNLELDDIELDDLLDDAHDNLLDDLDFDETQQTKKYNKKLHLSKELEDYKKKLIEHNKEIDKKQREYLSELRIRNINNGNLFEIKHQPLLKLKDDFLNFINRSKIVENRAKEQNQVGIFITLTLLSMYHKYMKDKKNKNKIIKNKGYRGFTIHDGYKVLIDMIVELQHHFYNKETKELINLDFVKVIEPHKTLTPHLHGIIYVDREHLEAFKEHIKKILGNIKLEIKSDTKILYTNNKNMGRCEIEVLRDTTRATSYLLKYISKNAKFEYENDDYNLYIGWKKKNKIRTFTTSKVSIPRYIYSVAYKKANQYLNKELLNDNYNMLQLVEDNINATVNIIDSDNGEVKTKNYGKGNKIEIEINLSKFKEYNEYNELITRYRKLQTLVTVDGEIIYDSMDFEVISVYQAYGVDKNELYNNDIEIESNNERMKKFTKKE